MRQASKGREADLHYNCAHFLYREQQIIGCREMMSMQTTERCTDRSHGQSSGGQNVVQGFPWWAGMGQQLRVPNGHLLQNSATEEDQGPPLLLATVGQPTSQTGYEKGQDDDNQNQQTTSAAVPMRKPGENILPHTQLELAHYLKPQTTYPYAAPYFGGIIDAYRAQAMMHGVDQSYMSLPLSEVVEEEPVYVNAKQYHGILRRRQSRAKAESEQKILKSRKAYLHESRHLHATRRARGSGGRFLSNTSKELKCSNNSKRSFDDGQSSQGLYLCGNLRLI